MTSQPDQSTRTKTVRPLPSFWMMVVPLLAAALTLRVTMTSIPPLIDTISEDLGLSHAMAGLLTALPVLCMGLFAPLASRLAHRVGAVVMVLVSARALLLGSTLRGFGVPVLLGPPLFW